MAGACTRAAAQTVRVDTASRPPSARRVAVASMMRSRGALADMAVMYIRSAWLDLDPQDAVVAGTRVGAAPGGAVGVGGDQPQRPVGGDLDGPDASVVVLEVRDSVATGGVAGDRQLPEALTAQRTDPE